MSDDPNGREMHQRAPWPTILKDLVGRLHVFPGWYVSLENWEDGDSVGLRLCITVRGVDSYHPEDGRTVIHPFIVPAATYNEQSWRRWVYERCMDVQRHELNEFFRLEVADTGLKTGIAPLTVRPYAPNHGPGNDPYFTFELGTREGQRTRNDGSLSPE